MLVIADDRALDSLADQQLQALLRLRASDFDAEMDGGWGELVRFVVLAPTDSLTALNGELGFDVLQRPFELIEEHDDWFEIVCVISDDGAGIEVFVPKHPSIDKQLLALCETHSYPTKEQRST